MRIRAAELRDAPAIAHVHIETWRSAYQGIVPDTYLASLSLAEREGMWRNVLADHGGARFVLLVHDEADERLGFAAAGPERSGDPQYRGELYALYVVGFQLPAEIRAENPEAVPMVP